MTIDRNRGSGGCLPLCRRLWCHVVMSPRINRSALFVIGCLAGGLVGSVAGAAEALSKPIRFNRDILPILSDNCFHCHGPDASHRKAKLRLDVREEALEREAFVPGRPEESELIARLFTTDEDEIMPPPESHKTLAPEQKALLQRWVAEGAVYQKHWAYERPVKPETPAGENAIDYLIGRRLAEIGLTPSPEADRRTLARRLHSDLVGLPPTPATVAAFAANPAPDAYTGLVERLLVSPHYGERMAIGWLDVARFADTIGYHSDNPRNIWPYRDYVIDAFNRNKPFDRFTREQLAGDLLPEPTRETKVASAFNRLLLSTEEGGAQAKDYEARMLTDRVRAVSAVWLGQTIGCAQCHDHKFDPSTQRDFYALGAFFADIEEPIIGKREAGMPLTNETQAAELAKLQAALTQRQGEHAAAPESADAQAALKQAQQALADYEASLPHCLVSVSSAKPRTVRLLPRGDWMNETGEIMTPALPAYLAADYPVTTDRGLTRLDLAEWLVSRDNPLTARVVMNRLWKHFFGIGISKVLDDFGLQGEPPAHPELLDWLACEFMDSGWDVKHMVRLMVSSRVYRQVSTAPSALRTRDPDNRELARQSRWRVEAELVRDQALSLAGLLVPTLGGPSVKPYQPDGYWENLNFPPRVYEADTGSGQYRRGLYTWWQRSYAHPAMLAFDAPTREECAADRARSNIPQQALVLLNDPTYVEAARAFAARIVSEGGTTTDDRLHWAWQQALLRPPDEQEIAAMRELVIKHTVDYTADRTAAEALLKVGLHPLPAEVDVVELAAWTSVARVILNLHETVTRG